MANLNISYYLVPGYSGGRMAKRNQNEIVRKEWKKILMILLEVNLLFLNREEIIKKTKKPLNKSGLIWKIFFPQHIKKGL